MIFVYLVYKPIEHYRVTYKTWKQMRMDGVECEILRQFKTIQDARAWVRSQSPKNLEDEIEATYTGLTPEGRERIREAKLGEKNPNYGGISIEHKQKIARAMKVRRGEFHHFYNHRHKPSSKLKTSMSLRRLPKRKWALDPNGNEHFLFAHTQLPPGWTWGRKRGVTKHF